MKFTPSIVPAAQGLRLSVLGDQQCIKLTGEHTNGLFTLVEQLNSPGTGIPRHVHTQEDETFHVQEGQVEYEVDGTVTTLGAGDLAYVPRGVAHSFRVVWAARRPACWYPSARPGPSTCSRSWRNCPPARPTSRW